MSVAMTADAVIERRKTVTRRKGWWKDKNGRRILEVGDTLTLCRKVQGRKPGEPIERLAEVQIVSIIREPLILLLGGSAPHWTPYGSGEMTLEGFPGRDPHWFVAELFTAAQGIAATDPVTRIEWRYLDDERTAS